MHVNMAYDEGCSVQCSELPELPRQVLGLAQRPIISWLKECWCMLISRIHLSFGKGRVRGLLLAFDLPLAPAVIISCLYIAAAAVTAALP